MDEAIRKASSVGFPLVLKIASATIVHKSDVGGIMTGINNIDELKKALIDMEQRIRNQFPDTKLGFLLQKQEKGKEVIIGMKRDNQFGPVILFGMGGIFVEVFKDVSMRIAPLEKKDIDDMIKEIKSYKILAGFRGEKAVDVAALADILDKVSSLSLHEKQINEIDFNPVIVDGDHAIVVDARMI
jgi:acyl-CoA synthetase (NDP forming)